MNYTPLDDPESIPTVFVEAWNNWDARTLAFQDAKFVNVVGLWWHDRESIRKAQWRAQTAPGCSTA